MKILSRAYVLDRALNDDDAALLALDDAPQLRTLLHERRYDDALRALAAAQATASHPRFLARSALFAQRAWRWEQSIRDWDAYLAAVGGNEAIPALANKARCMLAIGQYDDARAIYDSIQHHVRGKFGLAELAAIHDSPEIVGLRWDECISAFPNEPHGFLGKAASLIDWGAPTEAEPFLNHAATLRPDLLLPALLQAECLAATGVPPIADERWRDLRNKNHRKIEAAYARYLARRNDRATATEFLARCKGDPRLFAHCMLEYQLGRDEIAGAMDAARALVALEPQHPKHRLRLALLASDRGPPDAFHAALWSLKELHRRSPGDVLIKTHLIKALVRSGLGTQADELLRTIPSSDKRIEVLEPRAFHHHQRGEAKTAKRLWDDIIARRYDPAVHAPIRNFVRIDNHAGRILPGSTLVFSVTRNSALSLPHFLDHYRQLGASKFVIVDNASTDSTQQLLLQQPDVILYQTDDRQDLADNGMRWINELISRHGNNCWCIYSAPEQVLVFPASDEIGLSGLIDYMALKGFDGMSAKELEVAVDKDVWHRPNTVCPYDETFSGDHRLISKIVALRGGAGIHLLQGGHQSSAMRPADIRGALIRLALPGSEHGTLAGHADQTAPANDALPGNAKDKSPLPLMELQSPAASQQFLDFVRAIKGNT